MRVAQRTEGEGARGDDESSSVADLRVGAGQEHDVSDHHERGAGNHEDGAAVVAPGEEGEEYGEEGADDVGRHGAELLVHDGGAGVDSAYDGGREEGKALHGDVVQEEDEGCGEDDGVEDAAEGLLPVELVEDFVLSYALRLDAGDGEVLLFLGQPSGGLRAVGECEEGDKSQEASDDAFNGENHSPAGERAEGVQCQNSGCQKTTESTGQGRHDDVERQAESQL